MLEALQGGSARHAVTLILVRIIPSVGRLRSSMTAHRLRSIHRRRRFIVPRDRAAMEAAGETDQGRAAGARELAEQDARRFDHDADAEVQQLWPSPPVRSRSPSVLAAPAAQHAQQPTLRINVTLSCSLSCRSNSSVSPCQPWRAGATLFNFDSEADLAGVSSSSSRFGRFAGTGMDCRTAPIRVTADRRADADRSHVRRGCRICRSSISPHSVEDLLGRRTKSLAACRRRRRWRRTGTTAGCT